MKVLIHIFLFATQPRGKSCLISKNFLSNSLILKIMNANQTKALQDIEVLNRSKSFLKKFKYLARVCLETVPRQMVSEEKIKV